MDPNVIRYRRSDCVVRARLRYSHNARFNPNTRYGPKRPAIPSFITTTSTTYLSGTLKQRLGLSEHSVAGTLLTGFVARMGSVRKAPKAGTARQKAKRPAKRNLVRWDGKQTPTSHKDHEKHV